MIFSSLFGKSDPNASPRDVGIELQNGHEGGVTSSTCASRTIPAPYPQGDQFAVIAIQTRSDSAASAVLICRRRALGRALPATAPRPRRHYQRHEGGGRAAVRPDADRCGRLRCVRSDSDASRGSATPIASTKGWGERAIEAATSALRRPATPRRVGADIVAASAPRRPGGSARTPPGSAALVAEIEANLRIVRNTLAIAWAELKKQRIFSKK